jgi:long-chain acyl-CoA synthetase
MKKMLLSAVLKYVRKVVPTFQTPHVTLAQALSQGRAAARGKDIAAYSAHVTPDTTMLYQYTSGTTGRSKGAELTHRGILANSHQAHLISDGAIDQDRETSLIVLPLYHITAFVLIFLYGLRTGHHGVLVPSPRPPSNLKTAFEKYQVTWFTGINTLYAALLNEPWFTREMFERVKFSGSGGAAQTTGVAQKWQDFTGIEINQGYGMTEVCGVLTLNPPQDNRLGKVGIPVPGMEVRIVDDEGNAVPLGQPGEVIAKGPTLMKGYLNRTDATGESIKQGWYYSGDIGVMDEDGFIEIVDRKKDMILVSGFNVSPNEIEDVISNIPGVVQVGVIGVPDEKSGEVPSAFVVKGDDALTEEAIVTACHASLTNYKVPKHITFVDDVPVTLSGKVLRRELRDRHLGQAA